MNLALSSIAPEFETVEQETRYTAWLVAKIDESLNDIRPSIPHDEVMAQMDAIFVSSK